MKQSKIYFFQTYSTYVKQKGSVISLSEEDFKQFYSNVNGYYRNQMKSLRADYEKDVVIKNVKEDLSQPPLQVIDPEQIKTRMEALPKDVREVVDEKFRGEYFSIERIDRSKLI